LSNQPPTDPNDAWKPQDAHGRPPSNDPVGDPAAPVSGNPWSSPSGDALAPGPNQPPQPPSYAPGQAPLPQPPAAGPLPPTAQFPQQPCPSQPGQGYPPQPALGQPYPPQGHAPAGHPWQGYRQAGYPQQEAFAPQPPYGQIPGYASAPPGYGAPPPGPRRSNAPMIAVILAVVLLLCGGAVTAVALVVNNVKDRTEEALKPITEPAFPTAVPDLPDAPTDLPDLPTDVPQLPDPDATARKITVRYEVTGDGPASIIYTGKLGDAPKRVENATLPWRFETTLQGAALASVTAVRGGSESGEISCRVTVDGKEVAQRSRKGAFATASCVKMIF
jgi:Mycobacterium membrane protein